MVILKKNDMIGYRYFQYILLTVLLSLTAGKAHGQQMFTDQTFKFGRALALIEAFYVDSTDTEALTEKAIVEMLRYLDPHSVYISKEEADEMNEELQGNFEGIGIQFNILFDSIIVISPVPGGPSEAVGMRAGDRIVTIGSENVAGVGITTGGVRKRLLGEKGTKVNVGVYRRGVKGINDFTITRDKIPVNSLDAAYMLSDDVGFVKLNRFSATSEDEFNNAVERLKRQKMKHLIIDLRNNTGGYLEAAIRLTDQFFNERKLIVYLEGLKTPRQDFFSRTIGTLADSRIVVLVDEGSASASEILSGALQDWDRGVIAGRRTFGKGLVQNGFNFSDGSIMRLTVARYYTPTGRLIQRPYDDGIEKYFTDFFSRYTNGEVFSADSIQFPDSLKYKTLLNGRTVYGGGGIMPDLFIPADTSWFSTYYGDLVRKNVITEYSLDFTDRHRSEFLDKYRSFDDFNRKFSFTEADIDTFIERAEKLGVKFNEKQFIISEKQILTILKGLVARDLWDMSEYYQIVYADDRVVNEALKIISNPETYSHLLEKGN
ncbi:MAG TPA: S41 family peptidase [Bacteroidales bacterium]|nr:S41 family peptidase [Bacteroidales bacterium]